MTKIDATDEKTLADFQPQYSCRFHPTDSWHEVGCPHQEWTKEELQGALDTAKQSNAYLLYLLGQRNVPSIRIPKAEYVALANEVREIKEKETQ